MKLSINVSTEEMDIDAWDDDDEVAELIEHKPKRIIRRRIA